LGKRLANHSLLILKLIVRNINAARGRLLELFENSLDFVFGNLFRQKLTPNRFLNVERAQKTT